MCTELLREHQKLIEDRGLSNNFKSKDNHLKATTELYDLPSSETVTNFILVFTKKIVERKFQNERR
ncbi:hypothetical protein RO3G_11726 [Rhizopus delemar RA 99-880]|uniref:Uncharacterized protein n=1 Tax=Rhizopus delemar (strain RA 99-880 / ATCC MYA-4621 / FGSC 9543 / NRRL 43880) TaxID=246409 RepID=I1CEY5_RHIO9|nr:hypothetical protein RO3G_11726 [Rhizopus delemar RA 99-880]|eukprot:EIE87015.1 hypothetical protein RO3G_11726 [Rhizopus delemar RA 99-880]